MTKRAVEGVNMNNVLSDTLLVHFTCQQGACSAVTGARSLNSFPTQTLPVVFMKIPEKSDEFGCHLKATHF